MDDLISEFIAECREMLEALGGEIVAWEATPDDRARPIPSSALSTR
jgi:two-component system chemotaxis sensor kinase CheA